VQLYLGGHLAWYDPHKNKSIEVRLTQPTLLTDVLLQLKIPLAEIVVGVVNGRAVLSLDAVMITDNDKVELYPPVDGG
jgi:sulfur carrier protein ThiS